MFDRVLIMLLDYLSCFGMVLEGYMERLIYAKHIYSFQTKKFPLFWSHTWNTTFKLKKRQWTIEFDVFVLCFIFFMPLSQTISVINRNGNAIFYMHQNSGACASICKCDRTHQMKKTAIVSQRERNSLTCFNAKVQISNVKMKTFFFHPPACLHLF